MKQKLLTLFIATSLCTSFGISQAHAGTFLFGLFNKEKFREVNLMLQTFGPAAFTCYEQLTPYSFDLETMQDLIRSGEMQKCLQEEAAETARNLQDSAQTMHR